MPVSQEMKDHQASLPVFLAPIWKIVRRDGVVAAYASHSRPTVGWGFNPVELFIFNGVTYQPAPVQVTRDIQTIGLNPNSTEITGVLDDIITRQDIEAGKWKLAKVVYEYVCYLDLSLGSTSKIVGILGDIKVDDPTYQMTMLSNAALLNQEIGAMTSPIDRNIFPAGEDKEDWTITREVATVVDRRNITIDGAAVEDHFYKYGVITWLDGDNEDISMEIKDNIGNAIELQLPMPGDIEVGETAILLSGYEGTRQQNKQRFDDMINFDGEPDLPGIRTLLSYPE